MKQFSCGDVVPGCTAQFQAPTETEILQAVAVHARQDHHMVEIPESLVFQVKSKIHDAPTAH